MKPSNQPTTKSFHTAKHFLSGKKRSKSIRTPPYWQVPVEFDAAHTPIIPVATKHVAVFGAKNEHKLVTVQPEQGIRISCESHESLLTNVNGLNKCISCFSSALLKSLFANHPFIHQYCNHEPTSPITNNIISTRMANIINHVLPP